MKRLPHDLYVELAVIVNFIRYTQTEKDMYPFFTFGLPGIPADHAIQGNSRHSGHHIVPACDYLVPASMKKGQ